MKRMLIVLVTASLLGTAPALVAQMRGSSGMGQSRPSGGGMQGATGQQGMGAGGQGMGDTGRSGPMLTRGQRRAVMHTTQAQDRKYATCAHAMNQVRDGISHMGGMKSSQSPGSLQSEQSADAQSSDDGSEQLDNQIQDLDQDQNDFLDSLSGDQKTALEKQIKDVQKKMKEFEGLSKELEAELETKNADQAKIRQQVKKLDKLSKAIQNEQRLIAGALGIQS